MWQLKTVTVLCVLFAALCALPRELQAVSVHEHSDTLEDLEPDDVSDLDAVEGSGEEGEESVHSSLAWVIHTRSGHTHQAGSDDVYQLESFVALQKTDILDKDHTRVELASSVGLSQMEDGPFKSIDEEDKPVRKPLGAQREEILGQYLEEIVTTHYYPEYGVGLLENGCTGFMIGPKHALTTADCVYNQSTDSWEEDLDFWRGRNGDQYLQKMEWHHIIIPREFHTSGKPDQNWALITFANESPVWLRIAHTNKLHDVAMTVYGYLPDDHPYSAMYNTVCRSDLLQPHVKCLNIQCGADHRFSGGPVLKGYNFQRSKMPMVYAISVSHEDYSYAHESINIHEDLFWSLCYLMGKDGYDAKCGEME